MAVLTRAADPRPFPGAERVLAAHRLALPQPDQLCGPFAASLALHAVLDEPPSTVDLAVAARTAIWPHDVPRWRPVGARLDRTGWDVLPVAESERESGTNAGGVADAVTTTTRGAITPVPASGLDATAQDLDRLFAVLVRLDAPVGVVANVVTGPLSSEKDWEVGHFVILWGWSRGLVGIADSYAELGEPGSPPGCRVVTTDALATAVAAPPGRGILLLVPEEGAAVATRAVTRSGLQSRTWLT